MRQSAVRNQTAKRVSCNGSIPSNRGRFQAMEKLADDPTKAHPNTSQVPIPSTRDNTTLKVRPSRTMTSGSFKKKYSGLARQNSPGAKTKPNSQKTVLEPNIIKSQFSPGSDSEDGNGNEVLKEGPEHQSSQHLGKDEVSSVGSLEKVELPAL